MSSGSNMLYCVHFPPWSDKYMFHDTIRLCHLYYHLFTLNSVIFRDVTQSRLVWHRHFGVMHQSHLQGSSCSSWTAWPLKMRLTCRPKTTVPNQPMLHNIPEDSRIQVNCSGSLWSRISLCCQLWYLLLHSCDLNQLVSCISEPKCHPNVHMKQYETTLQVAYISTVNAWRLIS
jgi:hypothetical protein